MPTLVTYGKAHTQKSTNLIPVNGGALKIKKIVFCIKPLALHIIICIVFGGALPGLLGPDGHTWMFLGQFDHPGFKSEVKNFQ